MKEAFIEVSFRSASLRVIDQANAIIGEYQRQGFTLTLRQIYYQFVARGLLPNRQSEYKRLGSILDNGRQAGLIDWSAMEDRTRNLKPPNAWESPQSILNAVAEQYQENPWNDQDYWPEVWIEKDALIGVIEPVCSRMRVPYFACRGYVSSSETYSAGKRFAQLKRKGKTPLILHLGDHDPSGMQMTEDVTTRSSLFARSGVEVRRLALNMDQIERYNPPPNPAKDTDARFAAYSAEYGDESWELDALEPTVIDALIQTELDGLIDMDPWDESLRREKENKDALELTATNWPDVKEYVETL